MWNMHKQHFLNSVKTHILKKYQASVESELTSFIT